MDRQNYNAYKNKLSVNKKLKSQILLPRQFDENETKDYFNYLWFRLHLHAKKGNDHAKYHGCCVAFSIGNSEACRSHTEGKDWATLKFDHEIICPRDLWAYIMKQTGLKLSFPNQMLPAPSVNRKHRDNPDYMLESMAKKELIEHFKTRLEEKDVQIQALQAEISLLRAKRPSPDYES